MIVEVPKITSVTSTRDGYRARCLCLVDGFPAEVRMRIDTRAHEHSWFSIWQYDHVRGQWQGPVYELSGDEIGHMQGLRGDEENLAQLTGIAQLLWTAASSILVAARDRQDTIDTEAHVRDSMALDTARDERRSMESAPWRGGDPVDEDDPYEIRRGEFVRSDALHAEPLASDAALAELRAKLIGTDALPDAPKVPDLYQARADREGISRSEAKRKTLTEMFGPTSDTRPLIDKINALSPNALDVAIAEGGFAAPNWYYEAYIKPIQDAQNATDDDPEDSTEDDEPYTGAMPEDQG